MPRMVHDNEDYDDIEVSDPRTVARLKAYGWTAQKARTKAVREADEAREKALSGGSAPVAADSQPAPQGTTKTADGAEPEAAKSPAKSPAKSTTK